MVPDRVSLGTRPRSGCAGLYPGWCLMGGEAGRPKSPERSAGVHIYLGLGR